MKIDSEDLLVALLSASNSVWAAGRPFFVKFGVSEVQFNILNLLAQSPSPLKQQELADRLLVDRSAITLLIDRVEAKGLVKRQSSPTDRRIYFIVLTAKGKKLWEKIRPFYLKAIERLFAKIPKKEKLDFYAYLNTIQQEAAGIFKAIR